MSGRRWTGSELDGLQSKLEADTTARSQWAAEAIHDLRQHLSRLTRELEETRGLLDQVVRIAGRAFSRAFGVPESELTVPPYAPTRATTLAALLDKTREELEEARERERALVRVRVAVENDAVDRAVAAGLGVSEWRAFLPDAVREAIRATPPEASEPQEASDDRR